MHWLSWPGLEKGSGFISSLIVVIVGVVVGCRDLQPLLVVLVLSVPPVLAVQFGPLKLNRLARGCAGGSWACCCSFGGGPVFPNWIPLWGSAATGSVSLYQPVHR